MQSDECELIDDTSAFRCSLLRYAGSAIAASPHNLESGRPTTQHRLQRSQQPSAPANNPTPLHVPPSSTTTASATSTLSAATGACRVADWGAARCVRREPGRTARVASPKLTRRCGEHQQVTGVEELRVMHSSRWALKVLLGESAADLALASNRIRLYNNLRKVHLRLKATRANDYPGGDTGQLLNW
jgi:hypothetical protein